jgi:hypothetical protein
VSGISRTLWARRRARESFSVLRLYLQIFGEGDMDGDIEH